MNEEERSDLSLGFRNIVAEMLTILIGIYVWFSLLKGEKQDEKTRYSR